MPRPKKIVLTSFGTDGDLFPHLALGSELHRRGHRVTLVVNEHIGPAARKAGLDFVPLTSNDEANKLFSNPDFWHPLKGGPLAAKWGNRFILRQYQLFSELAKTPDTILASNTAMLAARLLNEKQGVPLASVILQPWMIPSIHAPPILMGGVALPRCAPRPLRKLYFRMLQLAGDQIIGRSLNAVRKTLGMKPVRRVFDWWISPDLILGLFPEWYAAPQPDWPQALKLTGFPHCDGVDTELPDGLLEFCQAGQPPVVFTFGTGMMHAANTFRSALAAAQKLGVRALILTKYCDQLPDPLPGFARHYHFAPFQKLFPHCAAVVHHGGIGTVAQCLAAGVPQLIMPIAFDQLDNALRVKRLGAGNFLKTGYRTTTHIAESLAKLLSADARTRSKTAAPQNPSRNAVTIAADLIEEL